jgi:hypothetical protein
MKGFGFKQLKRKEGPSFYLSGFKEKRKRNAMTNSTSIKKKSTNNNKNVSHENTSQLSLHTEFNSD